ncbi:MAG: DUF7305 domain-containing protein [Armatimonadota bacterium]
MVKHLLKSNKGSISMATMILMLAAVMVSLAVSSKSVDELRRATKIGDGAIALSLAEAGVDYTVAKLRETSGYSGTGGSIDFAEGSFSTTVTQIGGGKKRITSVGSLDSGTSCTVEVILNSSGASMFPDGAVVSNGGVHFGGQGSTETIPSGEPEAHVYANDDIQCNGQADIDGGLYAVGSITTTGHSDYTESVSGAPQVEFPDDATVDAMEDDWRDQALAGSSRGGISLASSQTLTITAPCYVAGNISLSSKSKLTITGSGPVYVTGNVSVSGQAQLINGTNLVVAGTVSQSGQSVYKVTGDLGTCALISLSTNSTQAIQVTGQANDVQMGVVYAMKGGIKLSGQGTVWGAIIAAGTSSTSIQTTGQATIKYPRDLISGHTLLPKKSGIESWLER